MPAGSQASQDKFRITTRRYWTKGKKEAAGGGAIFIDTSAWLAFFDAADRNHESARTLLRALRGERRNRLVTSDYVFDELMTRLRYGKHGHAAVVRIGEAIRTGGEWLSFVEVDAAIRDVAWAEFVRYDDQLLSFTDCTSIAIVRKFRIARVFTFDSDFRKVGLEGIP